MKTTLDRSALLFLKTLYETKNLVNAANQLGIPPATASRMLGKLREVFNDELRNVGLNPDNLKTDTLDKLKAEIQSVSAQMNQQKNAMAQTTAQINKANGSLAIETTRYKSLRSTIKQNGEALTEMGNKLDNALQEEAFPPVESKMTKFKNKVKSLGSA